MPITTSNYEKEKLEERLAKLVGGVAVINVGAATETELKEKKARVEDALHATRAAVMEGIVPGGGVALLRAIKVWISSKRQEMLQSVYKSYDKRHLSQLLQLPTIAEKPGQLVAEKVYEATGNYGYNGLTDVFSDLVKDGVIDPVLVTKTALINAASIASLLLTTAAAITEKPRKKKCNQHLVWVEWAVWGVWGMGYGGYGRNGRLRWHGRYGRYGNG